MKRTDGNHNFLLMIYILTLAYVCIPPIKAFAAPGQLDPAFGTKGVFVAENHGISDSVGTALAIQSDGDILIAGQAMTSSAGEQPAVIRLTPNGTLDTSFGSNGLATVNFRQGGGEIATGIVVQTNGKIVMGVAFALADAAPALELARLNLDGSLDTTFGSGGSTQIFRGVDTAYLVQQPDGKLLLGGGPLMARVNADGSVDPTFGHNGLAGLVSSAISATLLSNGKILAVSGVNDAPPSNSALNIEFLTPAGEIVRYNANGTVDTSFGSLGRTASPVVTSAALEQSNGQLVGVGPIVSRSFITGTNFPGVAFDSGFGLARYNPNGAIDTTFGTRGAVITSFGNAAPLAFPNSITIESNGDLIAAGEGAFQPSNSNPVSSFALARYTSTGALDTTFGSGGTVLTPFGNNTAAIVATALDSEGRLVVVGNLSHLTTSGPTVRVNSIAVARYLTD